LICAALALCAAAPAAAAAADVAAPLEARVSATTSPGTPWHARWLDFKRRAESESAGALRITLFIEGQIGNEDAQLAALRRGRIQMAGNSLQGLSVIVPELNVAMAPFLFDSIEEANFVYDRYLRGPVGEMLAAKGLALIDFVDVGWTNLYADRPMRTPEAAAGLRLRGAGNIAAQDFLRRIGADPIVLGSGDLVPALQTGLIQGGLSGVVFHYFVTRRYASDFALTRHSFDTGAVLANRAWFEAAPPERRALLRRAWTQRGEDARREVHALSGRLLEAMRAEGIRIHELSPAERARWREATQGSLPALAAQVGGRAQEIADAIARGKRDFAARPRAAEPGARETNAADSRAGESPAAESRAAEQSR